MSNHSTKIDKNKQIKNNMENISDSGGKSPMALIRISNFRFLLFGTLLANAAQWIQQVTINWLVYDITSSGTVLGSINMVRAFASLGIIPIAGVLIDRINRRFLMIVENGWLFVITFILGFFLLFGKVHIAQLFLFTFLAGIGQSIDMSLRQVVIFDLVPRSLAPAAVAIIQTGWALTRSIGPGIGGFILLWIGAGGNFLVQGCAYLLIAFSIYNIRFPERKPGAVKGNPLKNIREGLQYAVKHRLTRTFTMMGWIFPVFIIPNFVALLPIFAKDVFKGGSEVLGYMMSAVGVGGFFGGVFTSSLSRLERRGVLQLVSLFLISFSLISFSLSTNLFFALPFLAISGFFEIIFLTTNQTLLQLSIPDNMRGRVTGIVNLNSALAPVGCFIAGAGADFFGSPKYIAIILCSIAAVIAVCVFLGSGTVRNYRLSSALSENPEEAKAKP